MTQANLLCESMRHCIQPERSGQAWDDPAAVSELWHWAASTMKENVIVWSHLPRHLDISQKLLSESLMAKYPTGTLWPGLRRPCSGKLAVTPVPRACRAHEWKCHSLIPFAEASRHVSKLLWKSEALHPTGMIRPSLRRPCSGKWAVALSRKHDEGKCHGLIPFAETSRHISKLLCESLRHCIHLERPDQAWDYHPSWPAMPIFMKSHGGVTSKIRVNSSNVS